MSYPIKCVANPVIIPIASMSLHQEGIDRMMEWVSKARPECKLDEGEDLFPHSGNAADGRYLTSNELLVELAGRTCYHSYGAKAGQKTNAAYIENTQGGDIPHASIMYHAKMSFFIANISRRMSHELIRHYVGADRDEEGSPSQESTRYTEHPGIFVMQPGDLEGELAIEYFERDMQNAYSAYRAFIDMKVAAYKAQHGAEPKGIDRKRIYEQASGRLPHQCSTSFIWTSNPVALAKLFKERNHDAADREFHRLAAAWQAVCEQTWPNLFADSRRKAL